jgi:predicted CXXCH cytochrome family protein
MTFTIRQISRTADGREIVRASNIDAGSIKIGRDAGSDIHLADLAVELHHATITMLADGRINVVSETDRDFAIDGRLVQSVEVDTVKGSELVFGSHRLSVSKDGGNVVIAVERFEAVSDSAGEKEEIGLFTLSGLLAGRRMQAWSFITAVLVLFLAWPIYTYATTSGVKNRTAGFHADESWNSGPLSKAHAKLANDCQACHTEKFVAVTDNACRACHKNDAHDHSTKARLAQAAIPADLGGKVKSFFKASFNKPEGGCVDCHTEHEGEGYLKPTKQAFCTDCHSTLKERLDDTKLANVADFGTDHPQLQVATTVKVENGLRFFRRVSLDTKPTENNGLIFPHDMHLSKGNGVSRMAQTMRGEQGWGASLVCKDCHTPSADGHRFKTVNMEKDCQMCHSLGIGNGRTLTHGEPGQVVAQIRGFYASGPKYRPASLSETSRRRPGEYAAIETAQDYAIGTRIFQGQASEAIRDVFAKGGACYDCHIISQTPSRGAPVSIRAVVQPARYMQKGWFDHNAHKEETCESCHAATTSGKATDLLLPGISTCRTCHVGENGAKLKPVKDPVASSCALCHDYHLDNKAPWRSKLKQKRLDRQIRVKTTIASRN